MSEEPESLLLAYMRRFDERQERLFSEMQHLKQRMTGVDLGLAHVRRDIADLSAGIAGTNLRIDRVEQRLDRIERRLDLVDARP